MGRDERKVLLRPFLFGTFETKIAPRNSVSARAQSYIRKIVNWEQSINKLEDEHTMLLISVPLLFAENSLPHTV